MCDKEYGKCFTCGGSLTSDRTCSVLNLISDSQIRARLKQDARRCMPSSRNIVKRPEFREDCEELKTSVKEAEEKLIKYEKALEEIVKMFYDFYGCRKDCTVSDLGEVACKALGWEKDETE